MQTIFYGSIYDDEKDSYKEVVEKQFKDCSENATKNKQEVVRWAFDVLVEDEIEKSKIQNFVNQCAKKYFPKVESV